MFRFIYRELSISTIVSRKSIDSVNVFIKSTILLTVIIASIIYNNPLQQLVLLLYPLCSIILSRDYRLYIHSLKAPLIPAMLVSSLYLVFSRLEYADILAAFNIGLRIIVIASSILVYIATTNPIHLAYLFEKLRLLKWAPLSTILTWRLIPYTMRVADEAYVVSRLKGDSLWRSLVSTTATLLVRADNLVQTLYFYTTESSVGDYTLKPLVSNWSRVNTIAYVLYSSTVLLLVYLLSF